MQHGSRCNQKIFQSLPRERGEILYFQVSKCVAFKYTSAEHEHFSTQFRLTATFSDHYLKLACAATYTGYFYYNS